jgi:hypothetical protein
MALAARAFPYCSDLALALEMDFRPSEQQPEGTSYEFGGVGTTLEGAFAPEFAFNGPNWFAMADEQGKA